MRSPDAPAPAGTVSRARPAVLHRARGKARLTQRQRFCLFTSLACSRAFIMQTRQTARRRPGSRYTKARDDARHPAQSHTIFRPSEARSTSRPLHTVAIVVIGSSCSYECI